jgi:hypothetical protein
LAGEYHNAGVFLFPDVNDRDLWNYNLGGSAIYAMSRDFNLMLEAVAVWEEDGDSARRIDGASFSRCALRLQLSE